MPTVIESPLAGVLTALDRFANGEPAAVLADLRVVRGRLDLLEAEVTARVARAHDAVAEVHVLVQGLSQVEARRRERRATALEDAPRFADALGRGDVVAEHADALATTLGRLDETERTALLEHESVLLEVAAGSSPEAFARHCRQLATSLAADRGRSVDEQQRRSTRLNRRVDDATGMHHLTGQFHPELGARIFQAIDGQIATLRADGALGEGVPPERLAAEALGALAGRGDSTTRGARGEVLVTIDFETLRSGLHDASICETSTGVAIAPGAARRLCCDHGILPAVLGGDGILLDLGRTRRLASSAQRAALGAMHSTCAFPGCRVPFARCRTHHVRDWLAGGTTDLANLVPLCERHHWMVHEGGFGIDLDQRRVVTVRAPDGTVFGADRSLDGDPQSRPEPVTDPGIPPPEPAVFPDLDGGPSAHSPVFANA